MSRPRRSISSKTGGRQNMISWDNVVIDDSERESEESTDFGSDEIYMSDAPAGEDVPSEDDDYGVDDPGVKEILEELGPIPAGEPDEDIESELEGDFARNYEERTKRQSRADSTWDFNFQEEFRDGLREVSGIGSTRVRKRGPRPGIGPKLSAEAQKVFGDANLAFVSGQPLEALTMFQEVIRVEPKHHASWSALATCYEDLGEPDKALQVEIMGAHLKTDANHWMQLGAKSRQRKLLQQALYCYRKACRLNPDSAEARWELATICKDVGSSSEALRHFQIILKKQPHNISVIDVIIPVVTETRQFKVAIEVLQAAFDYYQKMWPHGPPDVNEVDQEQLVFQDFHIIALADFLIATEQYDQAIKTVRSGARWLQGRRHEMHLDSASDDREFDADGIIRVDEERLLAGEGSKSGTYRLDVNLRHRLAHARIRSGDVKEGRLHAALILKEDVAYFASLFVELADAFTQKAMYADALPIYERVMNGDVTMSIATVMNAGACYRATGKLKEAEQTYLSVLENEPDNRQAKLRLAEVYEVQNEPKKALALVYEVMDARKDDKNSSDAGQNDAQMDDAAIITGKSQKQRAKQGNRKADTDPERRRPTRVELQRREQEKTAQTASYFATLEEIHGDMLYGDPDAVHTWITIAGTLIDDFREARELFPADRYSVRSATSRFKGLEGEEDAMASRLEAEISSNQERSKAKVKDFMPATFRNVAFKRWMKVIVEYCLLLTSRNAAELAREVLSHVLTSYIFSAKNDPESRLSLQLAQMAIGVYTGNQSEIVMVGRAISTDTQFNNETLRILLGSLTPGLRGTDAFIERNLTKWSLRINRVWDMAVETRKAREARRGSVESEQETERMIVTMDVDGDVATSAAPSKTESMLQWNSKRGRWVPKNRGKGVVEDDEEVDDAGDGGGDEDQAEPTSPISPQEMTRLPTKRTPLGRLIQGSMLNASKVNHGALYYLFEAHEVQPDDPALCLALAVSTLGRSLGRRADNRQQLIVQGVAFLEEYRKYRGTDNLATQEVEYNFGRFFHQLNLGSFAASHYKRVLVLAEEWQNAHPDEPGFGPEAAYNLSLLYVLSGATQPAKELYRRWLSI
ncbi:hypothetical protein M408DRAFT_91230 [Serendipita vermifera MAFF 305830]|uniref:TPR-like protein n=1 Tax=Serendipita vermifera MAFF 305830 TaxID=933852 RepID=A0A0C3BRZ5_SERVB|nr:hypothetical protein M408DRAFT_91230 [Serendipita vermifera MAFF 305830]